MTHSANEHHEAFKREMFGNAFERQIAELNDKKSYRVHIVFSDGKRNWDSTYTGTGEEVKTEVARVVEGEPETTIIGFQDLGQVQ